MSNVMEKYIEQLKDIILENNFFDTLAGMRFQEWNEIRSMTAVIAFAGRSKKQQSYLLTSESDEERLYVTHLYIDPRGQVMVQVNQEDTDDFSTILKPNAVPAEAYSEETLKEWVDLLTY